MRAAKEKCRQRLLSLGKSLESLEAARAAYLRDPGHIHTMALIKSFEMSFELGWKALKDFLEHKEAARLRFAREAIKHAFHKEVIKDGQIWINMLEDRNRLAHVYEESLANQMAEKICQTYIKELAALKKELSCSLD